MKTSHLISSVTFLMMTSLLWSENTLAAEAFLQEDFTHKTDTIAITKGKTVHLILGQPVEYASLSSSGEIESRVVSDSKGIISFRAKAPFSGSRNLTLILAKDRMKVFIIRYEEDIEALLLDYTGSMEESDGNTSPIETPGQPVVMSSQENIRRINHISDRCGSLVFSIEQIRITSEGTELLLSLTNMSGSKFVPNSIRIFQRSHSMSSRVLTLDREIRYTAVEGNLTALSGQRSYLRVSIPQTTLQRHAMIEIYLHEYTLAYSMCLRIYPSDLLKAKKYCSTKRY